MLRRNKEQKVDLVAFKMAAEVISFLRERLGYETEAINSAVQKWSIKEQKRRKKRNISQIIMLKEIEKIIDRQ